MHFWAAKLALVITIGFSARGAQAQAKPADTKPATASPVAEEARAHYRKGVAHFNLDEWKQAVEEFRTAYRLYPDATFLYNIAQCHWKLGDSAEALSFYKKYLRERPDAPNRAVVEKRIEELQAVLAAQPKASPATP